MESGYRPELWHDLYIMLGGASAALTGLLFVALSLHAEVILKSAMHRRRARNNTIATLFLLTEAALILVPQQTRVLASEIVVVNILGPVLVPLLVLIKIRSLPSATALIGGLLGAAGGVGLFLQSGIGMFLVTLAYLVLFWGVVMVAWSLLTFAYQEE
jgi:hypothetical protein